MEFCIQGIQLVQGIIKSIIGIVKSIRGQLGDWIISIPLIY